MSYAINIERGFDGRVTLSLPNMGRLSMAPRAAVGIALGLLHEAGVLPCECGQHEPPQGCDDCGLPHPECRISTTVDGLLCDACRG